MQIERRFAPDGRTTQRIDARVLRTLANTFDPIRLSMHIEAHPTCDERRQPCTRFGFTLSLLGRSRYGWARDGTDALGRAARDRAHTCERVEIRRAVVAVQCLRGSLLSLVIGNVRTWRSGSTLCGWSGRWTCLAWFRLRGCTGFGQLDLGETVAERCRDRWGGLQCTLICIFFLRFAQFLLPFRHARSASLRLRQSTFPNRDVRAN